MDESVIRSKSTEELVDNLKYRTGDFTKDALAIMIDELVSRKIDVTLIDCNEPLTTVSNNQVSHSVLFTIVNKLLNPDIFKNRSERFFKRYLTMTISFFIIASITVTIAVLGKHSNDAAIIILLLAIAAPWSFACSFFPSNYSRLFLPKKVSNLMGLFPVELSNALIKILGISGLLFCALLILSSC